ncbi:MAG: metal dependent phosphohydrolase [Deltaproteobacteria bacterium]|nr:metal dependent phosphohydrolase [Deltaproteobacteria bacterium]
MSQSLRKRIEAIRTYLPPIPGVFAELAELLHDEDVDLRTLGGVIAKDPSMAVNVLRLANSAFYGLPNKVRTLEHAVTMLGTREITSLCMACQAARIFKPAPGEKSIDLDSFWRHSVATGVLAKVFCTEFRVTPNTQAYLAGLMHDVGKIILDRFLHSEYKKVVQLTFDENVPLVDAEKQILGDTHGTVGGWLMERWKLPHVFGSVATFHHSVGRAPAESRLMVAIVSLANQVARLKGFGFGGDETGVILEETEAFKVIREAHPHLAELDLASFIMDLDRTDADIARIQEMLHAAG